MIDPSFMLHQCWLTGTWKRSAGVAPEVNLREHVTCMSVPNMNKSAHSGIETQRRHHQKSKIWVSVVPRKGHRAVFSKKLHSCGANLH